MRFHDFPFEGGDILTDMGATWFVSYAYYKNIDRMHTNWSRVKTAGMRIKKYEKGRLYHSDWLKHVKNMKDENLNTNTIGLDAKEIKRMAQLLLENKQKANLSCLVVKEGMRVKLYDINHDEEISYEIISQSYKTHYIGSAQDEYGNYVQLSEQVLRSGGDGTTTLSTESPIGKCLIGHTIGDVISYKNLNREEEKFRILDIVQI